jgi:spermidine synthase
MPAGVAPAVPVAKGRADTPLALLFFASGFGAILYQLIWQRMLYALVGINVEVVTLIVSLFIGGLGIGSLLGGRASRADDPARLVRRFAAVELGIGLFGLVSPRLLGALGSLAADLSPPAMALAIAAVVLPPTMAMGATLPLLVTYLVHRRSSVGVAIGTLYCVNTLGSAFAAFAAGLLLMRWLGQSGVLMFAVGCNLTVAAAAPLVLRRPTP